MLSDAEYKRMQLIARINRLRDRLPDARAEDRPKLMARILELGKQFADPPAVKRPETMAETLERRYRETRGEDAPPGRL